MMRLQVLRPTEVLIDRNVSSIVAEAENGCFCLLPRHVDFVTALAPGILTYRFDESERFVGTGEGILVKTGQDVMVSVEHAVDDDDLAALRDMVRDHFEAIDERERQAVSAVARMEADFVRRFLELEERPHV